MNLEAELTRKLTTLEVLPTQEECMTLQGIIGSKQELGWERFCNKNKMWQVVHEEMIDAIYELLSLLTPNCLVEIGSGTGKLAYWLRQKGLDIIATDNYSLEMPRPDFVERLGHIDALRKYNPDVVLLCCPHPKSVALDILDYPSVKYLVHLGNAMLPWEEEIANRPHVRPNDLNDLRVRMDDYTYPTFSDIIEDSKSSNYLYEIISE